MEQGAGKPGAKSHKREADRYPAPLDVVLRCSDRSYKGRGYNVSRGGMLVALVPDEEHPETLDQAAFAVIVSERSIHGARLVLSAAHIDLDCEVLRICTGPESRQVVDDGSLTVACRFVQPLSDKQVAMLSVSLPAILHHTASGR
jgi:hypothetical protein